jgi:hypothetical protein
VPVRTTLTLDDDVAADLHREARRRGVAFRLIVNEAIRRGLRPTEVEPAPFIVNARPMGLRPGLDLDDIEGLLELLDGPARR